MGIQLARQWRSVNRGGLSALPWDLVMGAVLKPEAETSGATNRSIPSLLTIPSWFPDPAMMGVY